MDVKYWKFTLLLLALFIPGMTQAGWYVGVGVGSSNADSIDIEFDSPPDFQSDDQDSTYKVFGGITYGSNLALEFGYAELGEYSAQETGVFEAKLDPTALYLAAIGKVSVHPRVKMFGRLGLAYWATDLSITDFTNSNTSDDNGLDTVIGLGFEWRFTDRMDMRVEWEQFQNVGQDTRASIPSGSLELNGNDIDILGISLTYSFDLAPGP